MSPARPSHTVLWVIDDFIGEPGGAPERLPLLNPDHLDEAQREVYRAVTAGPRKDRNPPFRSQDEKGHLLGPFNAMLYAPSVGMPLQDLGAALRFRTNLSKREREIAILLVAAHARSAYEWYAHERLGSRAGLSDAEMTAIRLGHAPVLGDVRERVIYEAVRSLTLDRDLGDALFTEAVSILGRPTLVELVTLVGYYQALALQLTVFRTGLPDGEPAPRWEEE